ncbi:MAG: tetratricopeptide repeat protein [Verrucomicrobiota bacterium]|nr:tetratricopeptide repeat protein [Verrucomicrobiota bacterium]
MKKIALLIFLCALTASARAGSGFEQANAAYAAGNFDAAVKDDESDVAAGNWNANLFYNLGNAYFRAGDSGRAILNYERALQLDPQLPEADANLRYVRDESRALEMTLPPWRNLYGLRDVRLLTWSACVLGWLAIFLLIWRRRGGMIALAVICLLGAGTIAAGFFLAETGAHGKGAAIIVAKETQARVATADTAGAVLFLPPGSEVQLLKQRGEWTYAALPNDLRGWIPANAAEKIRLTYGR